MYVGHLWFALLFGYLAGKGAQVQYRRHDSQASPRDEHVAAERDART
jgi:hypothetical protein